MDGCTVKQEFASGSKMATSLSSKTHLEKYIKTQLLCHLVLVIRHQKSEGKKHLKLSIINLTIHPKNRKNFILTYHSVPGGLITHL